VEPTPPIGVIDSFGKGFETVMSQIALISIPLLLDLFLWLGPRLSVAELFKNFGGLVTSGEDVPVESAQIIEMSFNNVAESLNLFSFLSSSPLGVPSMVVSKIGPSPLGEGLMISITSWWTAAIVVFVVSLVGLFLGVIYFVVIAQSTLPGEKKLEDAELLERIWTGWVRIVGFAVGVVVAMIVFGVAVSMLAGLGGLVHSSVSGLVVSLGVAVWVWGLFYVAFAVHGIVMDNETINTAIRNSLLLVRFNMPSVVGLFGLIVLLLWGLGYLWLIPPSDSWALMIGIVGHAFVATGLYASTFHFYKDRMRWTVEVQKTSDSYSESVSGISKSGLRGNKDNGEKYKEKDN
jgi:hypothetical protein